MLSISWRILRIFSDLWAATFSEIDQFVLESWIVLFLVDNFRVHRFLLKKTSWKSWFFCVFRIPMVIPLKRKSIFNFCLKKNTPLIPVSIEVFCFYTFFNNLKFFEFSGSPIEAHSKGSQFSIFFWFLALIFGLAGVRICKGITLKSIFFSKSHKFFKKL